MLVMCAHQLRREQVEGRKKRPTKEEVLKSIEDPTLDDEQALRILRRDLSWKDWVASDYLRYWYVLGVLALDVFLLMTVARVFHLNDAVGIAILVGAAVLLVVAEVMGYTFLWPENALTLRSPLGRYLRRRRREKRRREGKLFS